MCYTQQLDALIHPGLVDKRGYLVGIFLQIESQEGIVLISWGRSSFPSYIIPLTIVPPSLYSIQQLAAFTLSSQKGVQTR